VYPFIKYSKNTWVKDNLTKVCLITNVFLELLYMIKFFFFGRETLKNVSNFISKYIHFQKSRKLISQYAIFV